MRTGVLQIGEISVVPSLLASVLGALGPDIDTPNSLISRRIPHTLFQRGVMLLFIPIAIGITLFVLGDSLGITRTLDFFSQTPIVKWGLILFMGGCGLFIISRILSFWTGHRGATHSLIFTIGITVLGIFVCAYWNVSSWCGVIFGWSWFTHLLADAVTERGLPYFYWPLK